MALTSLAPCLIEAYKLHHKIVFHWELQNSIPFESFIVVVIILLLDDDDDNDNSNELAEP